MYFKLCVDHRMSPGKEIQRGDHAIGMENTVIS